MLRKSLWLWLLFLASGILVWAAVTDFVANNNIVVSSVTFGSGTADMLVMDGSQAESWSYNAGTFTITNPATDNTFKVGSSDNSVEAIRVLQAGTMVACAYNQTAGTSYVELPTSAGTYTIDPSASDTACQNLCSSLDQAASYNDYPTCGAASCESGYQISGSGSSAICVANTTGGGFRRPVGPLKLVPTCTDSRASNYNSTANNGDCVYRPSPPVVCNDPLAANYQAPGACIPVTVITPPVEPPGPGPGPETESGDGNSSNQSDGDSAPGAIPDGTEIDPYFLPATTTVQQEPEQNGLLVPLGMVTGLLAGAAQLALLAGGQALSLYDLYLLLFRGLGSLFGLRKKSEPWGTVYDSLTKQPIDPAYVSILNLESGPAGPEGKKVASAITDLDGRFGFLLTAAGAYAMRADKSHYRFPSQILQGKSQDELYANLYFGEAFSMQPGQIVTRNIPLDPLGFDWNEFTKNKQHFLRHYSRRELWQARLLDFFFWVGFLATITSGLLKPSWWNGAMLLVYLLVYSLKWWWRAKHKPAVAKIGDEPLSFGVIRAYVPGLNQEVKRVVADMFGRFYLLLRPGTYYLTFEEKLPSGSYRLVHKTEPLNLKTGLFDKDVVIS